MPNPKALLATAVVLFLAACGGGTPPPPNSITLTVEDPGGSFGAALYQVGSGSWQPLTLSGTTTKTGTFNLGSQSKYGVAVRCGSGSSAQVQLIQATNAELANPKVVCSTLTPVPFTVQVNLSTVMGAWGIQPSDQVAVGLGPGNSAAVGSNTTVDVNANLPLGPQDLVITVFDPSGLTVRGAKVVRNVNVTNGGSTNVMLQTSDSTSLVNFTAPTLPSGYSFNSLGPGVQAAIFYVSGDNKGTGMVGAGTSYRPVAGFGSGDRYIAATSATNATNTGSVRQFKGFGGGAPSLSLPTPWPAGSLGVTAAAHPTISGLSYSGANLKAYSVALTGSGLSYQVTLSNGWLGSTSSYAVPDLSSGLSYTPFSGSVSVKISAVLSPGNLLSLDATDPAVFTASTEVAGPSAEGSYTVGGSPITLP
ncbi:hypothetical protein [Calidithermus timidus]|jgi:hypothetical protein|uniref:hypothetical protein n=1 Tax=Calidithermus timidus TaxID=307124 RepID=UPI00039A995F|nr:hypothetical protein [Calidithermus timidus]